MGVKNFFYMTTQFPASKTVFGKLIQPLIGLVEQCKYKRKCNTLPDHEWIKTGLLRILSQEPSGRAFLQKLSDSGGTDLKRSLFFETLKSKRLKEVLENSKAGNKTLPDFLKQPKELHRGQ